MRRVSWLKSFAAAVVASLLATCMAHAQVGGGEPGGGDPPGPDPMLLERDQFFMITKGEAKSDIFNTMVIDFEAYGKLPPGQLNFYTMLPGGAPNMFDWETWSGGKGTTKHVNVGVNFPLMVGGVSHNVAGVSAAENFRKPDSLPFGTDTASFTGSLTHLEKPDFKNLLIIEQAVLQRNAATGGGGVVFEILDTQANGWVNVTGGLANAPAQKFWIGSMITAIPNVGTSAYCNAQGEVKVRLRFTKTTGQVTDTIKTFRVK